MLTRREFGRILTGILAGTPVVASALTGQAAPVWSAPKPILPSDFTNVPIPTRQLYAKIRFTGPEIAASRLDTGQFQRAHQAWLDEVVADLQRAEDRAFVAGAL